MISREKLLCMLKESMEWGGVVRCDGGQLDQPLPDPPTIPNQSSSHNPSVITSRREVCASSGLSLKYTTTTS